MRLRGQQNVRDQRGYAMAALLVAIAVMGILMSAALPAWRHQAKREKEAELAFRGEQYVRAISLWERKMGPGSRPPNFDILVDQRFLRKKYKDPVTDGEFQPVYVGMLIGPQGRGRGGGRGDAQSPPAPQPQLPTAFGPQRAGGGIIGVRSRSTDASIRIYKGAAYHNQWDFTHAGASQMPGGIGSPTPGGGGRGARPGRPGLPPGRGRGQPGPIAPGRGFGPPGPSGPGSGPGSNVPPPSAPPGGGRGAF